MPTDPEISQYAAALFLLLVALGFAFGVMALNHLISPQKPTREKQLTYECGEDPIGSGWLRFNIRFYIVALIFVLFDVEMALVFPVAPIFRSLTTAAADWRPALIVFGELFFFVGVLALGLIYVWRKGDLGWIRSFRPATQSGMRSWPSLSPREPETAKKG
ncbi:MAG TPA: NADH-quinone oxidoreductase subunit A [Planctomycetota bacterium]|jgi:NADH-quinone oxidoreductase subunit A